MTIQELRQTIPEARLTKDAFGGDYYYIPSDVLSKRKAWNKYKKMGFESCPNPQYLRKDNIYLYNNKLKSYITIGV